MTKLILLLVLLVTYVMGDVYLHNPRGSNNRLKARNRDVNNQNRLFNSQNNARGGYNEGDMAYYEGSELEIEWTNQHSCGHENNNCEIILQYMCAPTVRDGASEGTPKEKGFCKNVNRNCSGMMVGQINTGMQEDYNYYLRCGNRERNGGLYTADQNLAKTDARSTRQNANGNRRGYECPEERDYYPYWHPTPWKDIGIMTNDVSRCAYYKANSENVLGRGQCVFDVPDPDAFMIEHSLKGKFDDLPNNEEDCKNHVFNHQRVDYTTKWVKSTSHGLPSPECIASPWSRDNHNGNGIGGYHNKYTWTIPAVNEDDHCVLRIRYNISTNDYDSRQATSEDNINDQNPTILSDYFDDDNDAVERGYVYENNPTVQMFPGLNLELNLAINTAQFGRTFQDRSHAFKVKSRGNDFTSGAQIYNVNVRGKRGNLQQVYPATEYDFVPNKLKVRRGDFVHFQWTGSDDNPRNNAGNGEAGTDRSNVVLLEDNVWAKNYPDNIKHSSFLGFDEDAKKRLAILDSTGTNVQLDDAGPHFDLGPIEVTEEGVFNYMSTRNNQFTNRCQKAQIKVRPSNRKRGELEDIYEILKKIVDENENIDMVNQ